MKEDALMRALLIAIEALKNGSRHMKFRQSHSHDECDQNVFEFALEDIRRLMAVK